MDPRDEGGFPDLEADFNGEEREFVERGGWAFERPNEHITGSEYGGARCEFGSDLGWERR